MNSQSFQQSTKKVANMGARSVRFAGNLLTGGTFEKFILAIIAAFLLVAILFGIVLMFSGVISSSFSTIMAVLAGTQVSDSIYQTCDSGYSAEGDIEELIEFSLKYLGTEYKARGNSENGFDSFEFVRYCLAGCRSGYYLTVGETFNGRYEDYVAELQTKYQTITSNINAGNFSDTGALTAEMKYYLSLQELEELSPEQVLCKGVIPPDYVSFIRKYANVTSTYAAKGDVVIFDTDHDGNYDDCGIYLYGGLFIHSSKSYGKVIISSMLANPYATADLHISRPLTSSHIYTEQNYTTTLNYSNVALNYPIAYSDELTGYSSIYYGTNTYFSPNYTITKEDITALSKYIEFIDTQENKTFSGGMGGEVTDDTWIGEHISTWDTYDIPPDTSIVEATNYPSQFYSSYLHIVYTLDKYVYGANMSIANGVSQNRLAFMHEGDSRALRSIPATNKSVSKARQIIARLGMYYSKDDWNSIFPNSYRAMYVPITQTQNDRRITASDYELNLWAAHGTTNEYICGQFTTAPVDAEIISEYGMRNNMEHRGIDYGAVEGTPIKAVRSGRVIVATRSTTGYGNHIVIDHGSGVYTVYAHCSSINVTVGSKVMTGQIIGTVGATGDAKEPHLHFEILCSGRPQNPIVYIPQRDQ